MTARSWIRNLFARPRHPIDPQGAGPPPPDARGPGRTARCLATFDVTIANDPGTNSAGTTGAAGTLSWALAQANAQAGPHTINIQTNVTLSGPLSPIFNSVTIDGQRPHHRRRRSHAHLHGRRRSRHHERSALGGLDHRRAPAGGDQRPHACQRACPGRQRRRGGGGGLGAGGALFVNQSADVTLTDVSFSGNRAVGGTAAAAAASAAAAGLGGDGGGCQRAAAAASSEAAAPASAAAAVSSATAATGGSSRRGRRRVLRATAATATSAATAPAAAAAFRFPD